MFSRILAIVLGKIILNLSRIFRIGGGSAAPGLYALKISPDLISNLASQIKTNIVITGTNGKTTTSKFLDHFLKKANVSVLRNSSGSNLERGIASALISKADLFGKIKNAEVGIWELDEAAFNTVAINLKPEIVVVLNVFRDQLDRYGETDTVISRWKETLSKLKSVETIILNGDDLNTAKLAQDFSGIAKTFGARGYKIVGEAIISGEENENFNYEATDINLKSLEQTDFVVKTKNDRLKVSLPLPGVYHIYDFLASFAVFSQLGYDQKIIPQVISDYSPAFGRVEKINLGQQNSYIFLIKNPAGTTQVLDTITPFLEQSDRLLLALNDNFADGTDVSWIWDANFEELQNSSRGKSKDYNIFCSGTRAYDLATRLKYAGCQESNIVVEQNLEIALNKAKDNLDGRLFILPTYTALLELQKLLAKTGHKKHYWKEQ